MLGGLLHRFAKNLTYAFVVEQNRDAPFGNKHRHAIAQNECFRMINLEPMAADKLDRKRSKRRASLKGS